jgi:signal peptidase I
MRNPFKSQKSEVVTPVAATAPSFIAEILQSVVTALLICIVIYVWFITPNQVSGNSMLPNFHDGELLLTNKVTQWLGDTPFGQSAGLNYERGDVVVFQKPGYRDFIKRVIAIPGDKVSVKNGYVYVNDKKVLESYIPAEVRTGGGTFLQEGDEITLKDGYYFLMGDNRQNSEDSRYIEIGPVSRDWMKGKVILRYWPPSEFGVIGRGDYEDK